MLGSNEALPVMYLLAGPNGAGKSTLYDIVIKHREDAAFINADLIQKQELSDTSMKASYKAAKIAAARRQEYLRNRRSFVTESVFSHPSKLELIKDAKNSRFQVFLFHINVSNPDISVARVAARVEEGGHDVPEEKIRARYARNQALIKKAVSISDRAFIYDNSQLNKPPQLCISFRNAEIEKISYKIPVWARELYKNELQVFLLKF